MLSLALIICLFLILTNKSEARINTEYDNDECRVVWAKWKGEHNFFYTKGNCQAIYDMCTEDYCTVNEIEDEDNFSTPNSRNIGAERVRQGWNGS